jgi:redox-sensitive bicupin YhaK (pirin superfamily)
METQIRRSAERGHADHGWLDTSHTFSFADYYDPEFMGFRALRVINEDFVAPAKGFGMHPHANMEIVTYVLEGELAHRDSLGNGSIIRPGEVQRMSAGTGVTHSEMNPSKTTPVHLLQIWILPDRRGYPPSYEQTAFPEAERRGRLCVVASPDGRDGSVTIHQDATLSVALLGPGDRVEHVLTDGRYGWLQVARGAVELDGQRLAAGDGLAVAGPGALAIRGVEDAEILVFDLP